MSKMPTSWDDVLNCECQFCRMLAVIRRSGANFCVLDCREFGAGFAVTDLGKLFVEPAAVRAGFGAPLNAAEWANELLGVECVHALLHDVPQWSGRIYTFGAGGGRSIIIEPLQVSASRRSRYVAG